jgi:hypothetical protein
VIPTNAGYKRVKASYAQVGTKLYVFTGTDDTGSPLANYYAVDLMGEVVPVPVAMPFASLYTTAVAYNEFVFLFDGGTGALWRFNTTTGAFDLVSYAPITSQKVSITVRYNRLYLFVPDAGDWSDLDFDNTTFVEYNLTTASWYLRKAFSTTDEALVRVVPNQGKYYGIGSHRTNPAQDRLLVVEF